MNDLKVSDIMCKWYIWAVVGYVIGKILSDTLGGLIGLVIGGLIGCYIQKNHSKVTVQPCHRQKGEIEKVFAVTFPHKNL